MRMFIFNRTNFKKIRTFKLIKSNKNKYDTNNDLNKT